MRCITMYGTGSCNKKGKFLSNINMYHCKLQTRSSTVNSMYSIHRQDINDTSSMILLVLLYLHDTTTMDDSPITRDRR